MKHVLRGALCAVGAAAILAGCDPAPATGPALRPELSKGVHVQSGPTDLTPPGNIQVGVSGSELTVTWDAVLGAVDYNVVFEVPSGHTAIAAGPNTAALSLTRDISGISDLTGYCVKVRANAPTGPDNNDLNNSAWSACVPLLTIQSCVDVAWDVKPGNGSDIDPMGLTDPTSAEIPVAIFGSLYFDVTKVDVASLRLVGNDGGAGTAVDTKNNGTLFFSYEDVDNGSGVDGILDLAVKFSQPAMLTDNDLTAATTGLSLTGTYDGTPFCLNLEPIRIVPGH